MIEGSLEGLAVAGHERVPPPATLDSDFAAAALANDPGKDLDKPARKSAEPPTSKPDDDLSFLEVLRTLPDAGPKAAVAAAPVPDEPLRLGPGDLPPGSVVPQGGYTSVLPEDDTLPDELDPDPCRAEGVVLPGIVLGIALKDNLKAKLGDCVQVTSPTIGYSFIRGQLRPPVAKEFRVTGVFSAGFDQYDSKLVYTDLYEAQAFYEGGDTVTGVEMKAMGASDGDLLRAFLYQGLIIGLLGTSAGLGFGYVVCQWIVQYGFPLDPKVYFISRLPVQLHLSEFVFTGCFAVAACLLATVWPALHAAHLRPAEAFREV
jgi:hypothetical protein